MQESGEEWNVESTGGQPAAFTSFQMWALPDSFGNEVFGALRELRIGGGRGGSCSIPHRYQMIPWLRLRTRKIPCGST